MYSLRAIRIPLWSYLFRVCDLQLCVSSVLSHSQRFSSSLEGLSHQHQLSVALCGDGGVPVKAGVLDFLHLTGDQRSLDLLRGFTCGRFNLVAFSHICSP